MFAVIFDLVESSSYTYTHIIHIIPLFKHIISLALEIYFFLWALEIENISYTYLIC